MADPLAGKKNAVVVRFKDGTLLKGTTHDFTPGRGSFHLASGTAKGGGGSREIRLSDLKAVFFVKSPEGNPQYREKKRFEQVDPAALRGLKISVEFLDGEIIKGVSLGYSKDKPGFFVVPVDAAGNNERIYVVADACRTIQVGSAALP